LASRPGKAKGEQVCPQTARAGSSKALPNGIESATLVFLLSSSCPARGCFFCAFRLSQRELAEYASWAFRRSPPPYVLKLSLPLCLFPIALLSHHNTERFRIRSVLLLCGSQTRTCRGATCPSGKTRGMGFPGIPLRCLSLLQKYAYDEPTTLAWDDSGPFGFAGAPSFRLGTDAFCFQESTDPAYKTSPFS